MVDLTPLRRYRCPRGGCAAQTGSDCERWCTATAEAKCCSPRLATPDTRRQRSAAARPRPTRGFRACARRTRARHGRIDRRSPRKQHRRRPAPGQPGSRRFGPRQTRAPRLGGTQRLLRSPPYAQCALHNSKSPAEGSASTRSNSDCRNLSAPLPCPRVVESCRSGASRAARTVRRRSHQAHSAKPHPVGPDGSPARPTRRSARRRPGRIRAPGTPCPQRPSCYKPKRGKPSTVCPHPLPPSVCHLSRSTRNESKGWST